MIEDSARLFRECRCDGAEGQEEEEPESTGHRAKGTEPASVGSRERWLSGAGDSAAVRKAVDLCHLFRWFAPGSEHEGSSASVVGRCKRA